MTAKPASDGPNDVWRKLRQEAEQATRCEPSLASFYHAVILNHSDLPAALSFHLASKLDDQAVPAMLIREVIDKAYSQEPQMVGCAIADMMAHYQRDPACDQYLMPFLYFKGFHALQAYRVAHWLWLQGRETMALFFQNQISQVFSVDIHPAAKLGCGIMIDHATGVVIGETAVVGDNVSMLHSVTLGGSGCQSGKRHPTIEEGVLISAGAKILGDICIGSGAKVGAGSVVLNSVAPHTTVAGVPAKLVGIASGQPALEMNQGLDN